MKAATIATQDDDGDLDTEAATELMSTMKSPSGSTSVSASGSKQVSSSDFASATRRRIKDDKETLPADKKSKKESQTGTSTGTTSKTRKRKSTGA